MRKRVVVSKVIVNFVDGFKGSFFLVTTFLRYKFYFSRFYYHFPIKYFIENVNILMYVRTLYIGFYRFKAKGKFKIILCYLSINYKETRYFVRSYFFLPTDIEIIT